MDYPKWESTPEERIIREKRRAKEAGITGTDVGEVIEDLVTRELTKLAAEQTNHDLRFSRGWIVEDYGTEKSPGASTTKSEEAEKAGPRLDIICYQGDVARQNHSNRPHALVPQSYAYGFIEVKKYLNPNLVTDGRTGNEPINDQLDRQRQHVESLGLSIPQVLLGIEYSDGSEMEVREVANADAVGLIESLTYEYVKEMANNGELVQVLDLLTPFPVKK